jgi:peptidoglycan/xylan/chitin deacetylase (PgdA/CDA1 family)
MWNQVLRRCLGPVSGRLGRIGAGRLVVLCYHDLREADDFTSWLRVEVGTFREHLEVLSKMGGFVAPGILDRPDQLPDNRLNFLLTFDDGYPNNLRLAADALEQFEAPALFFVSTHHAITGEPYWFDRVVTRIQAARLTRLDLSKLGLREYRFFAKDGARRWEGIQVLLTDLKRLGNASDPAVARVLDLLDSECGAQAEPHERWFRPINVSELKELATRRQTSFGSHGHRHEILTRLGDEALAESTFTSRHVLERLLNVTIDDFCYPNGDEDARVRNSCRQAGYRRGYVATPGVVSRQPDILRIPRVLIGGYDSAADVIGGIRRLLLTTRLRLA